MTDRELDLIASLSDAPAPSGFEDAALALVRAALSDVCDVTEDSLRNLYLTRRRNTGNKPLLMLDAHGDEVGFMIHSVGPAGTLRFVLNAPCAYIRDLLAQPIFLPVKVMNIEVMVTSPRPPIWIRQIRTIFPKTVKVVCVSATIRPVTQVADVAVNRASK